jgi:hypothetical protein
MFLNFQTPLILTLSFFMISCGGSSTSNDISNAMTFTASASVGEVIEYTIDKSKNTYSYKVTKSSYGLENTISSGTLTSNADGSYTPSENSNSRVYALAGGLLVGSAYLNLNGTKTNIPILGVNSPVTNLNALAGTYNYISLGCSTKTNGTFNPTNCNTNYGTILINADGTYKTCTSVNVTTTPTCSNSTGTLENLSGGIWKFTRTGSTANNYLMAYNGGNNQVVLTIDTNDPDVYGYGQTVASTQTSIDTTGQLGTYYFYGTSGAAGTTTPTATGYTTAYKEKGISYTRTGVLTYNSPWTGLVNVSIGGTTGKAIIAGSGLYAFRSDVAGNVYYEVGMKRQ